MWEWLPTYHVSLLLQLKMEPIGGLEKFIAVPVDRQSADELAICVVAALTTIATVQQPGECVLARIAFGPLHLQLNNHAVSLSKPGFNDLWVVLRRALQACETLR